MSKSIQCFYLLNGMEFIAEVVSEDVTHIKVKNLLAFNANRAQDPETGNIKMQIQLVPPTMFADVDQAGVKETQLNKAVIVFNYIPTEGILEQYVAATDPSPIVIARGNLPPFKK